MRDACHETVGDGGLLGLEQVERVRRRSAALEQISVAPATSVASSPKAKPPIQKNGELQNSRSAAVSPRISLRLCWCASSDAWVCTTPLGSLVDPDV